MTFEEAGQQFAMLQAQVRAGQIAPAQLQQMAAQWRVQDSAGRWWQIEPNSAQWTMWDGTNWVLPQPAAQPQPAATAPAPRPAYPQSYVPQPLPAAAPRPSFPPNYAPQPAPAPRPAYPQSYMPQPLPAVAPRPSFPPSYAPQPQPAPQPVYPQSYAPQPQFAAVPRPFAAQPLQQASVTVGPKRTGPSIWEGLAPVLPGLAIGLVQGWAMYSKDMTMLAGFVVPSLLAGVLLPLVPKIGRTVAIIIVIGCLCWLSWPVISQLQSILGHAQAMQAHAGRGLVGISLLYLIPRIWRIK
jgi:outer membrane biosynthesis protein TonB